MVTRNSPLGENSGVTMMVEYVLTLAIMLVLFSIMMLIVSDTGNRSDRIALSQEFGIIANSIAAHISQFTSQTYLSERANANSTADLTGQEVYFDLPQLVEGRQYIIDVTYDGTLQTGDVVVRYASNSNIYSRASFKAMQPVENTTIYSQPGRYGLFFDAATGKIAMRGSL